MEGGNQGSPHPLTTILYLISVNYYYYFLEFDGPFMFHS